MNSLDNVVEDTVIDYNKDFLSDKEKYRMKKDILSLTGALACLISGLIYKSVYSSQDVVLSLIYIVGILIIGVPVLITAIKGLVDKNIKSAMEILVSIAMIISTLDGQFILAILIPVILTFVHFLEQKSILGGRDAINGLKKMQSENAILYDNNTEKEVKAKDLKCNDIILIKPGMALPVDGRVVYGVSSIDQKSLTGESVPKVVNINDKVFAGTINIDGIIRVQVEKEYSDTSFQKIVDLLEGAENITTPETQIVNEFMMYYIPLVLIIALLVWLFTQNITRAIAILVVSCPCGHMLISSAPMLATISNATKKGILIKNSAFVEHLTETDYIIFDKTGTITNGTMNPENYYLDNAKDFNELVTTAAAVACHSIHPISKSIIALCSDMKYDNDYQIKEYIGKGIRGEKGSDVILLGSYKWIKSLGYDVLDEYENNGTCDWVVKNDLVYGCIVFNDSPREDAQNILKELKSLGINKTCLLTGDSYKSAKRILDKVQIDEMECELLPEQKLQYVEDKMNSHIVTVVGDGINDALALSKSHVGIAMGAMGSDTAIQSADIALMNNDLSNITYAIRLARKTKQIIYVNIILSFSISAIMIFLAGAGIISPILGAFLHNIGAFSVLLNSSRLLSYSKSHTY